MSGDDAAAWQERLRALQTAYLALPDAGTPEYWERLRTSNAEEAPPLEVLVRCLRERFDAGRRADAQQVFAIMLGRIQRQVAAWSGRVAANGAGTSRPLVRDDLAQECYLELWRVLTTGDITYWMTCFGAAMTSLQSHTAHACMERWSIWTRAGVVRPTRVPAQSQDSLDGLPPDGAGTSLGERIEDPDATRPFDQVEYGDLLELVRQLDPRKRAVVYGRYWRGMSQHEIAQQLGVKERAVRWREQRALDDLRSRLSHPGGPA